MKKWLPLLLGLIFTANLVCLSSAQYRQSEANQNSIVKPSLGLEYVSRKINWDDNSSQSKLKSYLFSLSLEFEIPWGFLINLIVGYSSTNYDGLIFRQLPFSVNLDVGGTGGYLLGGHVEKRIFSYTDFEVSILGRFFYSLGMKNTWQITDLTVTGKVEGKPYWMKADIGPVFTYTGFEYLSPYIFVNFNAFRGVYKMDESIQTLEGTEKKKFTGEGNFAISVGAAYDVSDVFSIKGEANFIPYQDGVDIGFMVKASYLFAWRRS